jgi:hypothetical protein
MTLVYKSCGRRILSRVVVEFSAAPEVFRHIIRQCQTLLSSGSEKVEERQVCHVTSAIFICSSPIIPKAQMRRCAE